MNEPLEARFRRAAGVLKALSHPLRLELVCGLRVKPCTQTFIAETLSLPQSTVAQHLKVLRTEGLVRAERRGVEVIFSLTDPSVIQIMDLLCSRGGRSVQNPYTWEELAALEQARRSDGTC
jgi:ArsR family transcriptional regulator